MPICIVNVALLHRINVQLHNARINQIIILYNNNYLQTCRQAEAEAEAEAEPSPLP